MVKDIKNKRFSMVLFSSMFTVILFFLYYALFSDIVDDYAGKLITEEVNSVANFLILIYSFGIFVCVLVSALLSDVEFTIALISSILSFLLGIIILSIVSYVSLRIQYPEIFFTGGEMIPWYEIVLNFSLWNTLFAVYILGNVNIFFVILAVIMIVSSYVFIAIFRGFPE